MSKQPSPAQPVLLVDDDDLNLRYLRALLRKIGINDTITCNDSRHVLALLTRQPVSVILLDLVMPHLSGEELLIELQEHCPGVPVVIVTGTDEVGTAVRCIKLGAFDYVVKPLKMDRLSAAIRSALAMRGLNDDQGLTLGGGRPGVLKDSEPFKDIVTSSVKMLDLFEYLKLIAHSAEPVLVTGETGVGKELLVRVVHTLSERSGPFVALNVAGVDDHMFTDTLFGHGKGAFTGAGQERRGLVEQARNGTLFLDEIGDLSDASQAKLLRLLQDGDYMPLGQDRVKHSGARVVSATNRDLWELVKEEGFREDLNFRLRTHHVHIPPLRERLEDLPLLIRHFLRQAATALGREPPLVPDTLLELLEGYAFPGNIRELRAMIFNALSVTRGDTLSLQTLRQHLAQSQRIYAVGGASNPGGTILDLSGPLPTLKEATDTLLREALKRAKGNQRLAGQMLGISQQAVSKRLKNLSAENGEAEG